MRAAGTSKLGSYALLATAMLGCVSQPKLIAPPTAGDDVATEQPSRILTPSASRTKAVPASFVTAAPPDQSPEPTDQESEPLAVAPIVEGDSAGRPVTLISVMEVVDQENPQVQVARQRVEEALAAWDQADAMWLPSIRAGVNYNKHEGRIQDVIGKNIEVSRGAFSSGLGTLAVGAGSPAIPGVYANFHLADAVFQPRIASERFAAREASAEATTNDSILQAVTAYLMLLKAEQDRAIAREIRERAEHLFTLADSYAKTGVGLAADADRAKTELAIRCNDVVRCDETVQVASARLAQLLRLDPTLALAPQEPAMLPIHLHQSDEPVQALVATALMARPEARESRALVGEAVERLQRERLAPLLPSVLLGISTTGFSAGIGGRQEHFADRFDADAAAWWELRNFGRGEAIARKQMSARVEQARWQELALLDQIAREVVEAHAQVNSRRKQLDIAEQAIAAARTSYERNLDRIQNGQGLPLEALQSLQALGQAQREYLHVMTDYNVAQFTLQRALGTLGPDVLAPQRAD